MHGQGNGSFDRQSSTMQSYRLAAQTSSWLCARSNPALTLRLRFEREPHESRILLIIRMKYAMIFNAIPSREAWWKQCLKKFSTR